MFIIADTVIQVNGEKLFSSQDALTYILTIFSVNSLAV